MSKRHEIRQRRASERSRRQITYVLITVGVALILVAVLILPNLAPAGDFVEITPQQRPQPNGTALGDPQAPVVVEIFEDFQCPACARYTESVESVIVDEYVASGQVYYVFHQYPFIGRESAQAAIASLCAADQGRFWDYHDILFANQTGENVGAYLDQRLIAFAESLGMDMSAFRSCFSSDQHEQTIQAEFQRGTELGVSGTPSVFVNEVQVSPGFVPSLEQLTGAIDQALAEVGDS